MASLGLSAWRNGADAASDVRLQSLSGHDHNDGTVGALMATPDLASALDSEVFLRFLDHLPIALIVSTLTGSERIVYLNPEFERIVGHTLGELADGGWAALRGHEIADASSGLSLGAAIVEGRDYAGAFAVEHPTRERVLVDAYSNIIEDDDGTPIYRLAALVDIGQHEEGRREAFELQLREKDALLFEVQHRVKNNLQMITALIRIEARAAGGRMAAAPFDRLAGRIEVILALYSLLSAHGGGDEIDLGGYLSQIASSVLRSHGVEGISLDMKVDAYPVSVNVAMPTGLVVNEVLTNSLKHAFAGRDGGVITLHSVSDGDGCRVTVSDDGNGLPDGVSWPTGGKLSGLIVQSLRVNAKADLQVRSSPGQGMSVTIRFSRAAAAPEHPVSR
jgi:two-component sensor histidine kinase